MPKQLILSIDDTSGVAAAFERGDLYLLDSESACSAYGRFRKVHVISKPAGGECRGYMSIEDGPWLPSSPCYSGEWTEMDREVERRRGITIARYRVTAGGSVEATR